MGIQILVVDDSPIIRKVVKRALALSGLAISEVLEACDGEQALVILGERPVDLVFADLNMPKMDGATLIRTMAADQRYESVPVVVVSADSSSAAHLSATTGLGIRACVRKPFHPELFRDLVTQILGERSLAHGP